MKARSTWQHQGHRVYQEAGDVARWVDDHTPAYEGPRRACVACHQLPTAQGYDHCLGHLPGVSAACCGHGRFRPYIRFGNGTVVELTEATGCVLRRGWPEGPLNMDNPQDADWNGGHDTDPD